MHAKDLKLIFTGAAAAIAAGLGLGALMHPSLDEPHDVGAPGRPLRTPERTDPGVTVYRGRVPEYVRGTDWTREATLDYPEEAAEPELELETEEPQADSPPDPPAWQPGPLGGWEATHGAPAVEEGVRPDRSPPPEG